MCVAPAACTQLKRLVLYDCLCRDLDLSVLTQLTAVRLYMSSTRLFRVPTSLRVLHDSRNFYNFTPIPRHNIVIDVSLSRFAHLEELRLEALNIVYQDRAVDLSHLSQLTRLTHLSLVGIGKVDYSFMSLAKLPALQSLALDLIMIPDQYYVPMLPPLSALDTLKLSQSAAARAREDMRQRPFSIYDIDFHLFPRLAHLVLDGFVVSQDVHLHLLSQDLLTLEFTRCSLPGKPAPPLLGTPFSVDPVVAVDAADLE